MKQLLSLVLVLTVALFSSSLALAEQFSIRNGITFNLSVEEVERIDRSAGGTEFRNVAERNKEWGISYSEEDEYTYCSYATLAGYSGTINYRFTNPDKKLYEIEYDFQADSDTDIDSVFNELETSLTKYDELSIGSDPQIYGTCVQETNDDAFLAEVFGYTSRIVPYSEYYVVIDHIATRSSLSGLPDNFDHYISYSMKSKSEVDRILSEKSDKSEAAQKSKDTDF